MLCTSQSLSKSLSLGSCGLGLSGSLKKISKSISLQATRLATCWPPPELPADDAAHGPLWQVSGPPEAFMAELAARGLTRVFCEGGGVLTASLLRAGLVDQLIGYTAGIALGADGRPAIGALALAALADAPRFRLVESRRIGPDLMHRWLRA